MMIYVLSRALVRLFFRLLYRVRVEGRENIPPSGPVIVAVNHVSNLDPPLVGAALDRPAHFLAKAELFRRPLPALYLRRLHTIPVERGRVDRRALEKALAVLRTGGVLVIFPEGTRRHGGELGDFQRGVAFLAERSGAPVIPGGISGDYKPGGSILLRFGPAVDLSQGGRAGLDTLRERIERLLVRDWDRKEGGN